METAKCPCCGKFIKNDEFIFQVRIVDGMGFVSYVPCCSMSCASTIQEKYAKMHQDRYEKIVRQQFQKMTLNQFGN